MNNNYLKEFMQTVSTGDYKHVKDTIITSCHISDDIWKNWLSGRTEVPHLAKPIIVEIVGRDIFNTQEEEADYGQE